MSAPQSIADTSLGWTPSEVQTFRHHQQVLNQQRSQAGSRQPQAAGAGGHPSSRPGSNVASASSSQGNAGRIMLDRMSLETLDNHFSRVWRSLETELQRLTEDIEASVHHDARRASSTIAQADEQIDRVHNIIARVEVINRKCEEVKRIRAVIGNLRRRVDALEQRVEGRRPATADRRR